MSKLNLGVELTKNEQKKVLGGGAICSNGANNPWVHCQDAASYCASIEPGVTYLISCY